MIIKVLGAGCQSCHQLFENAKEATKKFKDIKVLYITDMNEIMISGVMQLPALIINDKIKSTGRVLAPNEIIRLIEEEK